ncbi:hypothetical protein BDV28DRAFT_119332 [Aspergillus coremiiformis]|uniref:Uncharacterized protein n=1 Tax=Aspergillus coremiiformis TaxID=138285 RepID=A0A5N6YR97_9EURO|nr:hypothetical protein BDV28DRAFT_119332 [Aspergillus coremiiformis]
MPPSPSKFPILHIRYLSSSLACPLASLFLFFSFSKDKHNVFCLFCVKLQESGSSFLAFKKLN